MFGTSGSRALGVCCAFSLFWACGGDDKPVTGSGGKAGASGAAGKGSGGNGGTAGRGGNAGRGGTAGRGGSAPSPGGTGVQQQPDRNESESDDQGQLRDPDRDAVGDAHAAEFLGEDELP